MIMKAISLWQPWASAIALGLKGFETRGWATDYRGPLLIHAASSKKGRLFFSNFILRQHWFFQAMQEAYGDKAARAINVAELFDRLPFGQIVCRAELRVCTPTNDSTQWQHHREWHLGDFSEGRFAWQLVNVQLPTRPHFVNGRQRFFNVTVPDDLFV